MKRKRGVRESSGGEASFSRGNMHVQTFVHIQFDLILIKQLAYTVTVENV